MDHESLLQLYRAMVTARAIDQREEQAVRRGQANFHVSGAGHEGSAALAPLLLDADYLHLHYRSKALFLARGASVRGFFDMLYCKDSASSRGRQMSAHFSDAEKNVLSIPGPVGNSALQSVGIAAAIVDQPQRPLVVCTTGDGSTQEGEFLEAVAEAAREQLPVLFLIEDNQWAISTKTAGKTFFSMGAGEHFHGVAMTEIDGRDVAKAADQLAPVVNAIRHDRRPQIVVMRVERLAHHTNADDQSLYRTADELERGVREGDPIPRLKAHLLSKGVPAATLAAIEQSASDEIAAAEAAALKSPDPQPILTAKAPTPPPVAKQGESEESSDRIALTMKDALNAVLKQHLADDERVMLLGEDIEDPKGDVFGVTKGLSTQFPHRVLNAALTESTIVGTCVGRALAGQRPVAFLQFADFLPLALNQIMLEMGTMWWRTDGQWTTPVILMVPCGGYRPGLGPFHSHSLESVLAHTPGLDVVMPSNADDAAGLLNAAFQSGRPTVFFYPKALLNDSEGATTQDARFHTNPLGSGQMVRAGRDITLLGWGNTVKLCQEAAEVLHAAAIDADVIDLRSLSPWDERMVIESAEKTARLVVVHEDNHSCGMGAEILATVAEKARVPVAVRRVTRADTFVPCNFANQLDVLPATEDVLAAAAELLGISLEWEETQTAANGSFHIEAIGSGPSDENVIVAEVTVAAGDTLREGDQVAELEATKGVFDLCSPVAGTVEKVLVEVGATVPVGDAMFSIRLADGDKTIQQAAPRRRKPIIHGTPKRFQTLRTESDRAAGHRLVGLAEIAAVTGNRLVENAELLAHDAELTDEDVLRRTGIESRRWVDEGQDAVSMGSAAAKRLLSESQLRLDQIDLVVCATTTPEAVSPSMACRIVNKLGDATSTLVQAYDINAACSGYLYALQIAYDFLQSEPQGRVMIVTTEVLSPLLDPNDLDTAIIFSDAATASLICGESHLEESRALLSRPHLSAQGEDGSQLSVPLRGHGFIKMQGRKIFSEAIRAMTSSLERACHTAEIDLRDLDLVIPHQANGRIVEAVQSRLDVEVYNNIRELGNTSSSSIPLCLENILRQSPPGKRLGLCAFGAGFTFGAALLETKTATVKNAQVA